MPTSRRSSSSPRSACPWSSAISRWAPQPFDWPEGLLSRAHGQVCRFTPAEPSAFSAELPELLRKAVPKRQAEFLAGRWCVAELYQRLGLELPLPAYVETHGPEWPAGWTGSITHTQGFAAAALAPLRQVRAIGLDAEYLIEPATARRVKDAILHPAEVSLLDDADWIETLTLIFSFKESLYKALNPLLGRFIGFQELAVASLAAGQIAFSPAGELAGDFPRGAPRVGRWHRQGDLLLTAYEWSW